MDAVLGDSEGRVEGVYGVGALGQEVLYLRWPKRAPPLWLSHGHGAAGATVGAVLWLSWNQREGCAELRER